MIMLKKILAVGVLTSTLSVPAAQAGEWSFTYSTFRDAGTGILDPNYRVSGSFTGEDTNHNGWLERDELTSLNLASTMMSSRDYMLCGMIWEPGVQCSVNSFSYQIGHGLFINTRMDYHDEFGMHYSGTSFNSQVSDYNYAFSPWDSFSKEMQIVPQTRVEITAAVPEPETYAMLGAGLLLLSAAARRRKA